MSQRRFSFKCFKEQREICWFVFERRQSAPPFQNPLCQKSRYYFQCQWCSNISAQQHHDLQRLQILNSVSIGAELASDVLRTAMKDRNETAYFVKMIRRWRKGSPWDWKGWVRVNLLRFCCTKSRQACEVMCFQNKSYELDSGKGALAVLILLNAFIRFDHFWSFCIWS